MLKPVFIACFGLVLIFGQQVVPFLPYMFRGSCSFLEINGITHTFVCLGFAIMALVGTPNGAILFMRQIGLYVLFEARECVEPSAFLDYTVQVIAPSVSPKFISSSEWF